MDRVRPADNPVVLPFMHARTSEVPPQRRLPGLKFLPNSVRNHVIAILGEFVGTFLFLFFAFAATQVGNASAAALAAQGPLSVTEAPNTSILLYIALAFGFSLAVNVWVFFRISGGLFNPAVSLALALIGAVGWLRAFFVILSQIVAGIAAAAVVSALFPGPLAVRTTLSTTPKTSVVRGLFIEMFLTTELIFTIIMLAAEKHRGTFLAPVGIGLALFVAELAGVFFTGGSLNPARSFGPDVVLGTFNKYHWIYWLGPTLGAILAVLFYRLVKILEYETANPRADYNRHNAEHFASDEARNPAATRGNSARFDGSHDAGFGTSPTEFGTVRELHSWPSSNAVPPRGSSSSASSKPLAPPPYIPSASPGPSSVRQPFLRTQHEAGYLPGSQF